MRPFTLWRLVLFVGLLITALDLAVHLHLLSGGTVDPPEPPPVTGVSGAASTYYPYHSTDGHCSGPWFGIYPGNMNPIPRCPAPSAKKHQSRAFITMLLTPTYTIGALKLHCSLKQVKSVYPLVVLVPPGLDQDATDRLKQAGIQVLTMDLLTFPSMCFPRFTWNWTKLKLWTLTQFDKLVYLDSDTFLLNNVDDLFDYPADFAITADLDRAGNCGNCRSMGYNQAGTILLRPCPAVYHDMLDLVKDNVTLQFQQADAEQGFFNWYFYYNRVLLPPSYNFLPHGWWDTSLKSSANILHYTSYKPFHKEYQKYHDPWLECQVIGEQVSA